MRKGIGPQGLGAPKSPAKQTAKRDRLMEKSERLQARASKNTTPTAEYDPVEGKVMHSRVYTEKGKRLAKRADVAFNRGAGMSRSEARQASNEYWSGK